MQLGDDHGDRNQSPPSSTLPSIRELFGIRAGDNLNALVASPQRAPRAGHPPPSSYPQQANHIASPDSPEQRYASSTRSNSFSSGQTDSNNVARGTLSSPTTRSTSTSVPYATSPRQANPRSSLYPPPTPGSHSPISSAGSQILPPISAAIPEILPANRVRAVSDTEALTRGGLSPSSQSSSGGGGRSFRAPQPHHSEHPNTPSSSSAVPHLHHPSLRTTDLHLESAGIDQRRQVGRSAVQTASGAHYPPHSTRGHSHSILTPQNSNSVHSADDAVGQSQLSWPLASSRSPGSSSSRNNTIEYNASAPSSSSHEYSPHPFSSASLSARQGAGIHYPHPHHVTEGQPHLSSSSSRGSERAPPPSSFPHHHHSSGGNNNRPRSGHSSEGDETKSGYGKYECEYCSKRFNRPSSLRIHINTHTGAKPFQCPFPNCGRRFSVMSNMRRHARTHGTLLAPSADDDSNGGPHFQSGPAEGGSAPSSRVSAATGHHYPTGANSSAGHEAHELNGQRWSGSAMEIDELEGDEDEEEMDTDGGGGSSESDDGYPPSKPPGRLPPVNPSMKFGMLATVRLGT